MKFVFIDVKGIPKLWWAYKICNI